jgi:hypothetical protein
MTKPSPISGPRSSISASVWIVRNGLRLSGSGTTWPRKESAFPALISGFSFSGRPRSQRVLHPPWSMLGFGRRRIQSFPSPMRSTRSAVRGGQLQSPLTMPLSSRSPSLGGHWQRLGGSSSMRNSQRGLSLPRTLCLLFSKERSASVYASRQRSFISCRSCSQRISLITSAENRSTAS